jgi:Ca2+-binding EF-hand superfamily protein
MSSNVQIASKVKDAFRKYDSTGEGTIGQQDLAQILADLGFRDGAEPLLRDVAKDSKGNVFYRDFVDRVYGIPTTQVSIHTATPGDEVAVALPCQDGTVMKRTTCDVHVRLQNGKEIWCDAEDLAGGATPIHEVARGGKAKPRGTGDKWEVVDRTTCDVLLRCPVTGKEAWHEVENLEDEGEQSPWAASPGSPVRMLRKNVKARVKTRTTTDALVVHEDGTEAWYGVEDFGAMAVAPSEEATERLRQIFERCDSGKDEMINKRELIKICRSDRAISEFFGLASVIRQEDGSREEMERLFQAADRNSDRQLSWDEFRAFFLECMAGNAQSVLTSESALTNGAQFALTN